MKKGTVYVVEVAEVTRMNREEEETVKKKKRRHWFWWNIYLSLDPSFSIKSCRGASSLLSIKLNSCRTTNNISYTNEGQTTVFKCHVVWLTKLPEQRKWNAWRMCWDEPPPAAASQSQNAGGRCEHKPWTDASGWFWPQTWSS